MFIRNRMAIIACKAKITATALMVMIAPLAIMTVSAVIAQVQK